MAVGNISVTVTPDATDFWRSFRARTSGQAEAEGRRQGDEFRRGMQESASRGSVRVRADVDTTRARAEIKSLESQGRQSGAGLLQALLPLAPALAPLAGAAGAAGAAIGATMASSVLAVLGFKNALKQAGDVGARTAVSVGAVKDALSGLEASAAHAALPGLEQSVAAITSQLPKLTGIVSDQAAVAGEVTAHLTRGFLKEFENFGPVITEVSRDVDALAAHFESWATGPGGAHFAQALAADYEKVRPEIISVGKAVGDLLAAGSSSGLGIISLVGDLSRAISAFPRPVLTAIVDGILAFKAINLASTAISPIFGKLRSTAVATSATIRLSSLQATAARDEEAAAAAVAAAAEAEADVTRATSARTAALQMIQSQEGVQASYSAQAEALLAASAEEVAAYRLVAEEATAAAAQQVAAAEESAAAAETAGAAAGAASLGSILGPVGLAVGGLLLLTTAFGNDGDAAKQAASEIDGYTNALINSNGAVDQSVRARAAANLQTSGLITSAKQFGISQGQLTDAVLNGGSALTSVNAILDAHTTKASKAAGDVLELSGAYDQTHQSASILKDSIAGEAALFQQGASAAGDQRAAIDNVSEATREHARALHSTVGAYVAAESAAAGNAEKTREQTVAFQLANDAASLLSQALKGLAGQNLGTAQAETSFQQSIHSTISSLKNNHDAILGNSDAALTNQQAIQGNVSAARQYADAVAQQTGSSRKASTAYRNSRDALLSQLQAQGQLTPAVHRYINSLFDVKGVSDYLTKHPTKLDADATAAHAKIKTLRDAIKAIRQGKVPYLDANSAAGRAKIRELQRAIDAIREKHPPKLNADSSPAHAKIRTLRDAIAAIRQNKVPHLDANSAAAQAKIRELQDAINALRDKTVTVTVVHNVHDVVNSIPKATGGSVWGPGTGTSDSIPARLSNGEFVVRASQASKHRRLLENINQGAQGFAAGGSVQASKAQVQSTNALVPDAHSIFGALSGSVGGMRSAVAAFIKDFKAAGATTRQIARATADDARLVANQQRLVAARSKLANVTQYSDSIRSTLTGSFDPTRFGSVADLIGGYQGQTDQNNAYAKEVNALRKRAGKDGSALGLINTLAASGQTSSLEALYSGSGADLTNAGKAYKGYNSSVQGGVDAASTAKYGETQGQATKDVAKLVANSDRLIATIAGLGATVARSHGRSGKHVEQQLEAFATQLETLVRHGRH